MSGVARSVVRGSAASSSGGEKGKDGAIRIHSFEFHRLAFFHPFDQGRIKEGDTHEFRLR